MPVTADIRLSVSGQQTNPLDLGTAVLPFADSSIVSLLSGVGVGQADRVFTDQRTLAPSATEDLDLAGVLLDPWGQAITFAKIKALILKAAAGNTNNVNLSRPAGATGVPLFTAVSGGIVIPPGFCFAWFGSGAGVVVTPATGDLITLTNAAAGTPVTYDVVILGTST
jgi:hypothetical protein